MIAQAETEVGYASLYALDQGSIAVTTYLRDEEIPQA
jgi:hypothetical protein